MASAAFLPPEQAAAYTVIIDGILATADLNTISAKQIREGLQKQVQYNIGPQKKAIKELIMQRFDKFHQEQESKAASTVETVEQDLPEPPRTNGHAAPVEEVKAETSEEPDISPVKRRADSNDTPSLSTPPPKKKRKNDDYDADAALAAKLQAEENARSRPTRGGSSRKAAPPAKKKAKKKSKDKVSTEDDSDLESSRSEKKVNRNTGFHKLLTLSPALSALMDGEAQLSRPQATKRLWAYIKSRELQDPSDKRTICCDEAMKAVFKTDRINMFAMTKQMNQHLYADGE